MTKEEKRRKKLERKGKRQGSNTNIKGFGISMFILFLIGTPIGNGILTHGYVNGSKDNAGLVALITIGGTLYAYIVIFVAVFKGFDGVANKQLREQEDKDFDNLMVNIELKNYLNSTTKNDTHEEVLENLKKINDKRK